jgi:hypothetical protein
MNKSSPDPLTPLARAIYAVLRRRARTREPSITYAELSIELARGRPRATAHPRSSRLHAALGEVSTACRAVALPCLPAIVWRRDTRRPSTGYYPVAHPRASTERARIAAWAREHARVVAHRDRYPVRL